jgi:adenylate cyclase
MHANLVNNVLANDFATRAPPWAIWLGAVALGYVGLVIEMRRSLGSLIAFTALAALAYIAAAFAAWIEASVWLPLIAPVLGFAGLQFHVIAQRVLREQRAREQVKQMFGTYLSPELLRKMMKGGQNVAAVSSERRPVTILFSDLRDFTSLAETLSDDALIRQLNEYLAAMVECIHREGGTLHKFIGDAVMAVWGDLASDGPMEDAKKAARAALAMQEKLVELNESWGAQGMPLLRMGIGLNHGVVLIGNIGSPRRMEFTAIGDAVNLASRLESLNKELRTSVLAGESLSELIGGAFEMRPCGSVPVKGKAKAVAVFELLGRKPAARHDPN